MKRQRETERDRGSYRKKDGERETWKDRNRKTEGEKEGVPFNWSQPEIIDDQIPHLLKSSEQNGSQAG
jgi:hypothetical protein